MSELASPHSNHRRRRTTSGAIAAAVLATAAFAPAASASPTVLAKELRPSQVAAWNGTVAWSSYDPEAKAYRLMVSRDGGAPEAVPVDPSPRPFDVDLGTNRSGSTTAVYTRCDDGDHGCDVYRVVLASGREERLDKISSPLWDERSPTIFRGEIAFIRRETHGGRTLDVLRIGNTTSGSRGTRALVKAVAGPTSGLIGAELSHNRIAYVTQGKGPYGFGEQDVHVRTLRSAHDRLVYRARSGGANAALVTRPSLTEDLKAFIWARTNNGSGTGNALVRYTTATGRVDYARGSSRYTSSGWASDELGMAVFVDRSGTGTCYSTTDESPERSECSVQLTGHMLWMTRP
jgi:hypothetical protein